MLVNEMQDWSGMAPWIHLLRLLGQAHRGSIIDT